MKRRLTKFFTVLLTVMLVVGMAPATGSAAYAASWNSGSFSSWLSGLFDNSSNDSNESNDQVVNNPVNTTNDATSNDSSGTADEIQLTKTATDKGTDKDGNQIFDITLGVKGKQVSTARPIDVTLVVDVSGSMSDKNKMTDTKKAANNFVDEVLKEGSSARISVVKFSTNASAARFNSSGIYNDYSSSIGNYSYYSSNATQVKKAINALRANGGTNTEAGAVMAKRVTDSRNRSDADSIVIFLTDGEPTFYSKGGVSNQGGEGNICDNDCFDKAVSQFATLKNAGNQLYGIGFLTDYKVNSTQYNICEALLSDTAYNKANIRYRNGNYTASFTSDTTKSANFTKYYGIKNGDNASEKIKSIYSDLAKKVNALASGTIVDKIPAGFELTAEAIAAINANPNVEYDATNNTVTYTNVEAGEKLVTNTFTVKYVGNGYGAAYTNVDATYSGTLYNGSQFTKVFPKPVAGLHPKTKDDSDSTSVGTKITVDITENDLFKKLTVDGYIVSDYTILLTDKNGNPVDYTGDFNATIVDGQLKFTSTTAGTKELYYVVKANITQTGDNFAINGQTALVSRPTKVTIDVYDAANKAFVVDFGKPVTYSANDVFTASEQKANITLANSSDTYGNMASGTYGNMALNNDKSITYTLKKFMDGIDVFTFNEIFSDKVSLDKTVTMVPASSIYYEDNFADENGNTLITYGTGWTTEGSDAITSVVGDEEYGSDSNYANNLHDSGVVHCIKTGDAMGTATFDFKGTGIDIYSRVTAETGKVRVDLYKGTTLVARQTVNSVSVDGTRYQIPVFSFNNLERDTYTIKITVPKNTTYYLDGVRIYSSIDESVKVDENTTVGDLYDKDGEANATLYHLREKSLANLSGTLTVTGDNWITEYTDTTGNTVKAHASTVGSTESKKYGPLNEIYIATGQKVTITLDKSVNFESLQLGVKTIEGASSIKINETQDKALNSATDMFVKVEGNSRVITVENTGDNLVSLTYLKVVQGK